MACTDVQTIQAGNGTKLLFSFSFPYIFKSEIHVYFWNVVTKEYDEKLTTDATYPWQITDANPTIVEFTGTAPPSPATPTDPNEPTVDNVKIARITKLDEIQALFNPGSAIRSEDLNKNFDQLRYAIQESKCQGVPDDLDAYLKNYYWDKFGEAVYSTEAWVSDDAHVATTAAMDARFQDEATETYTKAELSADSNVIPDNDVALPTTGAVKDYVDHVVETDILGGTGLSKTTNQGQVTINLDATAVTAGSYTAADITVDAQGRITAASSGAISTSEITDGAVTSAKIADGTIVNADINASAAIDGSKLDVELNDLSNVSVASPNLNELLKWDGSSWVAGSVSGVGTVTSVATGTGLTGGPITAGGTISVANGGIDTTQLADDAVTAAKLANTAVTAASYTAADITVDAQGRITSAVSGTIDTNEIADNAITSAKIAAGAIINSDINANAAIGLSKLATGSLPTGITVESANIVNGTIIDADISATAEIAVSKLANGTARQLLQTDVAGTGVEFTSNVDVPGTLDVSSTAVFDGNVGIGKNSPATTLHLRAGNPTITLEDGTGSLQTSISGNTGEMSFSIAGSEAMRIDTSGNVGIGTDTPLSKLHLADTSTIVTFEDTNSTNNSINQITNYEGTMILHVDPNNDSTAAESMRFSMRGSEAMRISSSGNVGIGTSNPQGSLNVLGPSDTTNTGATLQIDDDAPIAIDVGGTIALRGHDGSNMRTFGLIKGGKESGTADEFEGYLSFQTRTTGQANTAEHMRIDSSGKVGIGTSSPSSTLTVTDSTVNPSWSDNAADTIQIEGSISGMNILAPNTGFIAFSDVNARGQGVIEYIHADDSMRIRTAGVERMRITSSGNVGIGTISPIGRFTVIHGASRMFFRDNGVTSELLLTSENGGAGALYFGDYADTVRGGIVYNSADNSLQFRGYNNTERMRISSGGVVRIGQTTSDDPSGSNVRGVAIANGYISAAMDNGNAAVFGRRGSDGGCVLFRRQTTNVGSITVNGSSTAYNTSSDYRLKENVVDLDGAIDRVKQLAPKRFNFIVDADTTVDGFLAHEAQAIVPEAVTGTHNEVDDDGNAVMQGIDQSKLVPLLTAALQEAIAKIEALEQRLTDAGL